MERYLLEVMGGILIVLSSVVGEALSKPWKKYSYAAFAIVAILYVSLSINLDRDINQHGYDLENSLNEAREELKGARADLSNFISQGVLVIKSLNMSLAGLQQNLAAAKDSRDPNLIASLQSQVMAAREQVDSLSKTALLSLAPGIVDEMKYWAHKWDSDDRDWWTDFQLRQTKIPPNAPLQESERVLGPLRKIQSEMNIRYTKQVLPMMTSANYLREQLLQGSELGPDDRKNAIIFDKVLAGDPIDWRDMRTVASYMDNLVKKFSPAPPSITAGTMH